MAFADELARFRRDHEHGLIGDDGWLAQIALIWLERGQASTEIGRFTEVADGVRFVAAAGAAVALAGAPVGEVVLRVEATDSAEVLTAGTRSFQLVRRGGALAVRVRDAAAPARASFRGLRWYPPRPDWRIVGQLVATDGAARMRYTGGQEEDAVVPGVVTFSAAGGAHRLVPYARPDGSLLIVFRDRTSGDETCALCRYFSTPAPDAAGRVVLDFNRAAAPICELVEFVTCILPPPENDLALRVEAGERRHAP